MTPSADGKKRDCGMNWNWLRRFRETKLGKLLSMRRKLRSELQKAKRARKANPQLEQENEDK